MRWDDVRDRLVPAGLFRWDGDPDRDLEAEATEAGWTVWFLDTGGVASEEDFYGEVRSAWGLPPWFGDNLDALFDALRDAVAGPSALIWDGSGAVGRISESFAVGVMTVLRDAIAEADAFAVILRDEPLAELAEPLD
jgi:RNAse (barnase) inhibitor barstar